MADLVLFGEPPEPAAGVVLFSSGRRDWRTPEDLYRRYVPPCFDVSDRHGGTFDALADAWPQPWWCNPPYGPDLRRWTARMRGQGTGVALLPARTDTPWFHEHILGWCRIEFVRGRLRFGGSRQPAPFPSILCHFGDL